MKWYARDPHRAIEGMTELTLEECGAYNLLLDHSYARDGDLPDDAALICRILRCHGHKWNAIRGKLISKDKAKILGGKIVLNGVENTLKTARIFSENQSKRAAKRWQKSETDNENNEADMPSAAMPIQPQPQPQPHKKGLSKDNPKKPAFEKATLDLAVKAWNALAASRGLPKVQSLTATRKVALMLRLADLGGPQGFGDLLRKVQASRFLIGDNDKGWTADFDWILKPANMTKIMEGKYDNREGTSRNSNGLAEAFNAIQSGLDESGGAPGDTGPDNPGDSTSPADDLFRNRGND